MLNLTPAMPSGEKLENIRKETLATLASVGASVEEVINQYEVVYSASLLEDPNIFVPLAVDETGNVYEDITVHFTSTFTLNGDRYVTDGAVIMNYDEAIRVFKLTFG